MDVLFLKKYLFIISHEQKCYISMAVLRLSGYVYLYSYVHKYIYILPIDIIINLVFLAVVL